LQKQAVYTNFAIISKNLISYLLLSKGGINLFSKNFELTIILRNFLFKTTEELLINPKISNITKEENFFSNRINSSQTHIMLNKSLLENPLTSAINSILIHSNSDMEINENFIIKINFLQLRYLLEEQFVV
jgi:hypothetical protein